MEKKEGCRLERKIPTGCSLTGGFHCLVWHSHPNAHVVTSSIAWLLLLTGLIPGIWSRQDRQTEVKSWRERSKYRSSWKKKRLLEQRRKGENQRVDQGI